MVIVLLLIFVGVVLLKLILVEQYLVIIFLVVNVSVSWLGVSVLDVVEVIVVLLEIQFNGVDYMLYMEFISLDEGMYCLSIIFVVGIDVDLVVIDV